MAHFGIVAPPAAGHLSGLGSLGCELKRRGHQATVFSGDRAENMTKRLGLPVYNYTDDAKVIRLIHRPLLIAAACVGMRISMSMRVRIAYWADQALRRLPGALRELQIDALLVDRTQLAAGTVAEHLGLPFATVSTGVLWNEEIGVPPQCTGWSYREGRWPLLRNRLGYTAWHLFLRPAIKTINRFRRDQGLKPLKEINDTFSPMAQLSQMCPELDFPRAHLSRNFHYIGSLAEGRPERTSDFPWERLDGRPLIYASVGTVHDGKCFNAFPKIAEACAGLDAQLVIALGKWRDDHPERDQAIRNLPGDPIVVGFAPQIALLERASLLITHAGANTVLEALSAGVPMVALPRAVDQPAMSARVVQAGVGVRASFNRFKPSALRRQIIQVLSDPSFRQRARHIGSALRAAGGVRRAADLCEQLLLGRQPSTASVPELASN